MQSSNRDSAKYRLLYQHLDAGALGVGRLMRLDTACKYLAFGISGILVLALAWTIYVYRNAPLWTLGAAALFALVWGCDCEPVRADADLGASIIRDMIERLALSDLVLADVTIANANVFYEVGIRHAACETGCVLLAASWAKAPFDTQSMRREPYVLAGEELTDEEARVNLEKLEVRVRQLANSKTPCYEMEGFPRLPITRAQAFRDWLRNMNAFNADVTAIRIERDLAKRHQKGAALVARYTGQRAPLPLTIAYELVKIVRDTVGWKEVVELIDRLPQSLQDMPLFKEQRALARSKSGEHQEAIATLLELIQVSGESAERWGLIGGRYKKLFRESRLKNPALAADYLDQAIEHYDRGRICDLNDYYASSNLPLLLRTRGSTGDAELAARIAVTGSQPASEQSR